MEQKNLLEIRMKENDSVPEVYWRVVQLDALMIDREGANGKFHLASDDAEINPLLDADRY